jgi:hypothetical protein
MAAPSIAKTKINTRRAQNRMIVDHVMRQPTKLIAYERSFSNQEAEMMALDKKIKDKFRKGNVLQSWNPFK